MRFTDKTRGQGGPYLQTQQIVLGTQQHIPGTQQTLFPKPTRYYLNTQSL